MNVLDTIINQEARLIRLEEKFDILSKRFSVGIKKNEKKLNRSNRENKCIRWIEFIVFAGTSAFIIHDLIKAEAKICELEEKVNLLEDMPKCDTTGSPSNL